MVLSPPVAPHFSGPQSIGSLDHWPSLPLTEGGPGKTVVRQKECPDRSLEQAI